MARRKPRFSGPRSKGEAAYEGLKREILDLGYLCTGTILERLLTCGKRSCRCFQNPAGRHGPYLYWSTKIGGRTSARRIDAAQKALYDEGIRNQRSLARIIKRMMEMSLSRFLAVKKVARRGA
jgi:hypothetical protein